MSYHLSPTKWASFMLVAVTGGCSATDRVVPNEILGRSSQKVVTGNGVPYAVTPFNGPNAAETETVVAHNGNVVVAFNYEDDTNVTYSPPPATGTAARSIRRGASIMGWNYSTGPYGSFNTPGRIAPPTGWSVLWGDPGLGQLPFTDDVFMTSLAVPDSKFPASGSINGSIAKDPTTGFSPIGGGCVARSTDDGQTFTLDPADCVHTPNYDIYDGSEVVGAPDHICNDGLHPAFVLAAFLNDSMNTLDVWRGNVGSTGFTQLSEPFPNMGHYAHPRMYASLGQGGIVYLLGGSDAGGGLYLQYWNDCSQSWGQAPDWPKLVGSDYYTGAPGDGLPVGRDAAQFDLAANADYQSPEDVMVVYQVGTTCPGINPPLTYTYLKAVRCSTVYPGSSCGAPVTIGEGSCVSEFMPALGTATVQHASPDPSYTVAWKLTWQQRNGQDSAGNAQVSLYSQNLGLGGPSRLETSAQTPCATESNNGGCTGYWGDYDSHLGVYQASPTDNPVFFRSFSDSTDDNGNSGAGVCNQTCFNATVHVSNTVVFYP